MILIKPRLYTYRRCPYAIRSRLALYKAKIAYEPIEISLKHKSSEFLALSPKGTVPVLIDIDGAVIEESLEIMLWALSQHDPECWLLNDENASQKLIDENDFNFKKNLDRYKYADRFPEHSKEYYRSECEIFLNLLNDKLQSNNYLMVERISLADAAIFPFVRQFSLVDEDWFLNSRYQELKKWLHNLINTQMFQEVMRKD
ncbi:glutathione S-transferase [Candidatus Methylopumilus universalis]|jgi:glutathione S-transferase|uniref:glutathione S-transferase n=1 Tax=Candidatus Methylopumilus universalis TaxID=2588536 RepID=UPI00294FF1F9|nr:glutathione S-transferase [Candidatus Methylopumilus universalis]